MKKTTHLYNERLSFQENHSKQRSAIGKNEKCFPFLCIYEEINGVNLEIFITIINFHGYILYW